MRKLLLISALLLASASAQAEPNLGPMLASADTPAPVADTATPPPANTAQPLPPAAQPDQSSPQASTPAPQASAPVRPHVSKPHVQARRHESDEAKARRIAAKYGVYW